MLFLGLLALIQCWFLPGFTLLSFAKSIEIKDKIILSPLFSIIVNYLIVVTLLIFQKFTFENIIILILIELILILFFLKKNINLNSLSLSVVKKKINLQINFILLDYIFIFFILFFYIALNTIGEVVHLGDPVMMWNEWSKEIYNNNLPKSGDYPLAFPILGAITYLFLGTYDIEFFSRAVCIIYPLWMFAIYLRLRILLPDSFFQLFFTFFFTLIFIFYIFRHYALYIGYVDPILFFITFSLGYFYFLLKEKKINTIDIILISMAFSTPAITKQTGILLTAILPFILLSIELYKKNKINYYFYFKIIFLIFLFSATWYVYKIYGYFFEFSDNSNIHALAKQVDGSFYYKILRGLDYAFGMFYPLVLLLLFLSLKNFYSKIILFYFVIPYFLIWSLFFGNDNRNLALALPAVAYVMSCGLVVFYDLIKEKISRNYINYIGVLVLMLVFVFSFHFVNEKRDKNYLIEKTLNKKKIRGDNIQTNILIYENLKKNKNFNIYTDDYNFTFLPDTNNKIILISCSKIESQLNNSYLLYSKKLKGFCNKEISRISVFT